VYIERNLQQLVAATYLLVDQVSNQQYGNFMHFHSNFEVDSCDLHVWNPLQKLAGISICTANSSTHFCETVITKTLQAVSMDLDEQVQQATAKLWTSAEERVLLQFYRENRIMWDFSNPEYHLREKRNNAKRRLVASLGDRFTGKAQTD